MVRRGKLNTIPTREAIAILENAHRLALNSKGHPRSMSLIRYLDSAILDLKARNKPSAWSRIKSWIGDPDALSFFGGRG